MLNSLKQCCSAAVFVRRFQNLTKKIRTPYTADEGDNSSPIPRITSIGDEICAAAGTRSDENAVKIYREQCTAFKIQELEVRTRDQSSSFLWHLHRKGRITGSTVHQVLHRRQETAARKLVSKIMAYDQSD